MTNVTTIEVNYKHVEGWHVFTADSIPGMYVASKDAELAYNDIAPSLQQIIELEFGVKCEVMQELPFAEFIGQRAKASARAQASAPRQLSNQRYAITCIAA